MYMRPVCQRHAAFPLAIGHVVNAADRRHRAQALVRVGGAGLAAFTPTADAAHFGGSRRIAPSSRIASTSNI
jgi:hypothetical protein